jgi:hypothetical protein
MDRPPRTLLVLITGRSACITPPCRLTHQLRPDTSLYEKWRPSNAEFRWRTIILKQSVVSRSQFCSFYKFILSMYDIILTFVVPVLPFRCSRLYSAKCVSLSVIHMIRLDCWLSNPSVHGNGALMRVTSL